MRNFSTFLFVLAIVEASTGFIWLLDLVVKVTTTVVEEVIPWGGCFAILGNGILLMALAGILRIVCDIAEAKRT